MSQLLRETAVHEGNTALLDPPVTDTEPDDLALVVLPKPRPAEDEATRSDEVVDDRQGDGDEQEHLWRPDDDIQAECVNIAIRLSELPDVGDRIDVYNRAGIKKLSRAAALRPELVPYLNDELEWITLTSADAEP